MTRSTRYALLVAALCVSRATHAQDHLTPFLHSSVSGVAGATALNYDFAVSTYQLLTTNLRFEDKSDKQKLNFAPGKLRRVITECTWRCELTLNLVRSKDVSTFGLGGAWITKAIYTEAALKDARRITENRPACRLQPNPGEDTAQFRKDKEACFKRVGDLADDYFKALARENWTVTYGGNVQTFASLGSTKVDLDGDGIIDNAHAMKGWNANLGFVVLPSIESAVSGSWNFTRKRGTAADGQRLTPYHAAALSGVRRVKVLDADYKTSDNFKKKLFVPALMLGLSLEAQWCMRSVADCEERIQSVGVATPFMDVKVSPEAQFRLGFPVKRAVLAGKKETTLLPLVQLGFSLGSL